MAMISKGARKAHNAEAAYDPPRLEKALAGFIRSEYLKAEDLMGEETRVWHAIRLMWSGHFRRDPEDNSPLADMYEPVVAQRVSLKSHLHLERLIPDPATMNMVELSPSPSMPKEEIDAVRMAYARTIQEEGLPSGDAERMKRLMASDGALANESALAVTVSFRQMLARSNLYQSMGTLLDYLQKYGPGVAYPVPIFKEVLVPIGEPGDAESLLAEGIAPNDLVEIEGEWYRRSTVYDGQRLEVVSPFNLLVGDLTETDGIDGLSGIFVYQTRTRHDLEGDEVRKRDGRHVGAYSGKNLVHIKPTAAKGEPSIREHGAEYDRSDWFDQAAELEGDKSFVVPVWMGRIPWYAVDGLMEDAPTKREREQFAQKFGFDASAFDEPDQFWIVEFERQSGVLLRAQPYFLSGTAPYVSARWKAVPGHTLGLGVYESGAGDAEIMYNNAIQDVHEQVTRFSRPMYTVIPHAIDMKQKQSEGFDLSFRPNRRIDIMGMGGQDPIKPLVPPTECITVAMQAVESQKERIQRITGVSDQFLGQSSGAKSATEASNQERYLDKVLSVEQQTIEMGLLRPLLQKMLAVHLEGIRMNGGATAFVQGKDLRLWSDEFSAEPYVTAMVAPEMAGMGFRLNILTTGANGNIQEQITRLMQTAGLATQLDQQLLMRDHAFDTVDFFRRLLRLNNLPESLVTPLAENPALREKLMGVEAEQQGGAPRTPGGNPPGNGNPGGAGVPRPNYQRTAPEVPAPGEFMAGQAQGVQQSENAGRPPING